MGQQQLLLLVLGIVIVGLAVVVGINAFSENRIKSNADALVTDGLRIVSDLQAWVLKPEQFGGGNDGDASTNDFDGTLQDIGYTQSASADYTNVNGTFQLDGSAPSDVTCTSPDTPENASSSTVEQTLFAYNAETGNCVQIDIYGTKSQDIATEVTYGS